MRDCGENVALADTMYEPLGYLTGLNELTLPAVHRKLLAKEERMWEAFCQLDVNKDGKISAEEMQKIMTNQSLGLDLEETKVCKTSKSMVAWCCMVLHGCVLVVHSLAVFIFTRSLHPLVFIDRN